MKYKNTPIHNSFAGAKQRCRYSKHASYADYGDRRAKVSEAHNKMQEAISNLQDTIGDYTDAEIAFHFALDKEIGEQ